MEVYKDQLVNAIADFIAQDIAKDIKEASLKAMAMATVKVLKVNPSILDKALENSFVEAILCKEDEVYHTESAEKMLRELVAEQGKIILTIPAIPFIHPDESKIGLAPEDIEKLINRIHS